MRYLVTSLWLILWFLTTECLHAQVLTRAEAIRLAIERNPEVIAARRQWNAAQARVTQARALLDPEFEMEFEELPGGFSLGQFGERNIGITQRLEFPAKWVFRNRAATQNAKAIRLSAFEMTKIEIATRVRIAYDRVLADKQILRYTEQNLQLAGDFLEKSRTRFRAGDVAQLVVLRAEVETGRAATRVTSARYALDISKAELNVLLARDIRTPVKVAGDLDVQIDIPDLDRLKALAQERRPDLLGAGQTLASARSMRSTTISSLLPDLNVGIFRQTIRGTAPQNNFWHVTFGVEIPIWGVFRQRGQISEANAVMAQATAMEDASRYRVALDVERAFLDLKNAREQERLFRDQILREAQLAHDMANRSYREGKATYLEVLEAQRVLMETRVDYAGALFNVRSALATLERAVGGNLPR